MPEMSLQLDRLLALLASSQARQRREPGELLYIACAFCGRPVSLACSVKTSSGWTSCRACVERGLPGKV